VKGLNGGFASGDHINFGDTGRASLAAGVCGGG
jgi:hypothetical protein